LHHFGVIHQVHLILHEIPAEHPCFGCHNGFMGGAKAEFFFRFVGNSYVGKVTKAFPHIFIGYEARAKRSAWGFLPPGF
jgi:hypothetical protein